MSSSEGLTGLGEPPPRASCPHPRASHRLRKHPHNVVAGRPRSEGPREDPALQRIPLAMGGSSTKHKQQGWRAPGQLGGWLPPWLLHQGLPLWLQETSGWGGHALGPLHDQPVPKASGSCAWHPGCFSGQRSSAPLLPACEPWESPGSRGPLLLWDQVDAIISWLRLQASVFILHEWAAPQA